MTEPLARIMDRVKVAGAQREGLRGNLAVVTLALRRDIAAAAAAGARKTDIAEAAGISRQAVHNIIRKETP